MELLRKQPGEILLMITIFTALTGCFTMSTIMIFIVVAVIEFFRIKPVDQKVAAEVLGSGSPCVIAHRGAGLDAPENTLAAFREAKKNGAGAVEFDVAFTKDGVAVILHDETVDRTTDGSGNVGKLEYDYVKTLNASTYHPLRDQFPNQKIPTLEEAVKECLDLDLHMYIDVKAFGIDIALAVDVIDKLYKKFPKLYKMGIVCCFNPWVIYKVRRTSPEIVTVLINSHRQLHELLDMRNDQTRWKRALATVLDYIAEWSHNTWFWHLCGNSGILLHSPMISSRLLEFWKERGVQVMPWTINTMSEKQFYLNTLEVTVISDTIKGTDDDL